jgi:protease I
MDRKILVVTGDGGEGYEVLYAVHRFQEGGFVPVLAAPSKRWLNLVMHDFEPGWDTYVERPGYRREADIAIADAKCGDYEAVLLIGGRAPEYLRNDPKLLALVREFQARGKWIFSICHGIQILNGAGLAKGRKLTCYEHVRSEVEACGGTFVAEPCVRDGNMVSAQTWQDHPWFFREVFNCLTQNR